MHPALKTGNVAIYARFSSDRQREASIEDQVRRCREHIARAGGDPDRAQVYSDFAVSGSSMDRPGFEALMHAVEQDAVAVVVTEDLSRISRDFADSAQIFKRLQFAQIPLIGVADGIDTSSKGAKLSFTVKSLVADLYLDDLRDKTLRGLEGRAMAGYATGNTPYGYRTTPETDASGQTIGHRIEIHEEQAERVRQIFDKYLCGFSLTAIAKWLTAEGIPSPRAGTRHKRKGWGPSTIRAMLYNEKYAGVWKFKERQWVKVPGSNRRIPRRRDANDVMTFERPELRIIKDSIWQQTQTRLAAMKRKYTRKKRDSTNAHGGSGGDRVIAGGKSTYLLSGILVCGKCGAPMTIHGGTHAKYYRCSDFRNRGTCANGVSIREEIVRREILGGIRDQLMSPSGIAYVRKRIAAQLGDWSRKLDAELCERRARLQRTEDRIRGLVTFIADGDRSDYVTDSLRDLGAMAKAEKVQISSLERATEAPLRLPSIDEVTQLAFGLDDRLMQDPAAGRERLRTWFKNQEIRLTPHDDGTCTAEGDIFPLAVYAQENRQKKDHEAAKYANHRGLTFVAGACNARRTTRYCWTLLVLDLCGQHRQRSPNPELRPEPAPWPVDSSVLCHCSDLSRRAGANSERRDHTNLAFSTILHSFDIHPANHGLL